MIKQLFKRQFSAFFSNHSELIPLLRGIIPSDSRKVYENSELIPLSKTGGYIYPSGAEIVALRGFKAFYGFQIGGILNWRTDRRGTFSGLFERNFCKTFCEQKWTH
jgi:hypothetical protein